MRSLRQILAISGFLLAVVSCTTADALTPELTALLPPSSPTASSPPVGSPSAPIEQDVETNSIEATPTISPTQTPTVAPSPTPIPTLQRLTVGGCCVGPAWSPDGLRVWYIDRPAPEAPAGLWGVDLQGGGPDFLMDRLGIYSPDQKLLAFPMNNETVIERLSTGEQWQIPNGGRSVSFSPDGDWLAWTGGDFTPPFDRAEREVWVSRVDGSEARQVFTAIRGGFAGWLSGERILVSGLVEGTASEQAYWALSLNPILVEQSELMELGRGGRLREAKISSDGSWLAYLVTFGADPSQDGLWLAEAISGERKRLEVFGGYNWRDGEHLLVVPLDLSEPVHELLQVHAPSGHVEPLTDPSITPFRIANGDWSVSPDGGKIVFVSADDGNIWVLDISEFIK